MAVQMFNRDILCVLTKTTCLAEVLALLDPNKRLYSSK